jgi:hypothetical protein
VLGLELLLFIYILVALRPLPTSSTSSINNSSSLQDPHRSTAVRTRVFVSKHNQSTNATSRDILN